MTQDPQLSSWEYIKRDLDRLDKSQVDFAHEIRKEVGGIKVDIATLKTTIAQQDQINSRNNRHSVGIGAGSGGLFGLLGGFLGSLLKSWVGGSD